jgi:hypothetical protein
MLGSALHRRWAREFLARAQDAPSRQRKLHLLKLAVSNSVRAQILEKERLKRTRTPAVRKRVFELTKAVAKGAAE